MLSCDWKKAFHMALYYSPDFYYGLCNSIRKTWNKINLQMYCANYGLLCNAYIPYRSTESQDSNEK